MDVPSLIFINSRGGSLFRTRINCGGIICNKKKKLFIAVAFFWSFYFIAFLLGWLNLYAVPTRLVNSASFSLLNSNKFNVTLKIYERGRMKRKNSSVFNFLCMYVCVGVLSLFLFFCADAAKLLFSSWNKNSRDTKYKLHYAASYHMKFFKNSNITYLEIYIMHRGNLTFEHIFILVTQCSSLAGSQIGSPSSSCFTCGFKHQRSSRYLNLPCALIESMFTWCLVTGYT